MSVFVTVGTTSFDDLIRQLDQNETVDILAASGYNKLTLQIGRGEYVPTVLTAQLKPGFQCEHYRFKPSLHEDMASADLIISHAGAGSIMESLRLKRPLIVVVNEKLMDNHQLELAEAMQEKKYLRCCYVSEIHEVLRKNSSDPLKTHLAMYPSVDYGLFPSLVDKEMGFSE